MNIKIKKHGRLEILEKYKKLYCGRSTIFFLCKCDCDNIVEVVANDVLRGHTTSCGCYSRELASKRFKKYNKYDISGEYGIGFIDGRTKFYFDLEDYEKIKDISWYARRNLLNNKIVSIDGRNGGTKIIKLNNFILNFIPISGKIEMDHIDKNPCNNRKNNLRICTRQENSLNRSISNKNSTGIMGVSWENDFPRWNAYLTLNGKKVFHKRFKNKEDAIVARLKAEKEYFGEFSPQKHLFKKYGIE